MYIIYIYIRKKKRNYKNVNNFLYIPIYRYMSIYVDIYRQYIDMNLLLFDVLQLEQYASRYAFGYRIRDFNTGNDFGHKQNRDVNGVTRGQYHILLPDGRIQNVIYHADDTGFHADVTFEAGQ